MGSLGKYELDQRPNSRQKVAKETRWDRNSLRQSRIKCPSVRPSVRRTRDQRTKRLRDHGPRVRDQRAEGRGPRKERRGLVHRFIKTYTHQTSKRSSFFHRWTTGAKLISAIPNRIRSLSSALDF